MLRQSNIQPEFDFSQSVHQFENNIESQETLEIKKADFEGQNKKLFDLLMSGKKVTFFEAITLYGISDIRRRAMDLTKVMGFVLSKEFVQGSRCKYWYMKDYQIEFNKNNYKEKF